AQRNERDRSVAALSEALSLGLEAPEWVTPDVAREWTGEQWRRLLPRTPGEHAAGERTTGAGREDTPPLVEALAREQAGDLAGAIQSLARAVAEQPGYADLRCRLAGLLLEAGRIEEARSHLRVALELNPRYLEARLLAARCELEAGDAAAAEEQVVR